MSRLRTEPTALLLLTDAEKAAVLDELMADDVELERRAEQAGRRLLATVTAGHVASAVAEALLALDQDDLAAHAGRTRYGYVEPTEAAWWLLERAIEPWLEDLARRASLGLEKAPRQLGLGTLEALDRVGDHTGNDELLLSWARLPWRGRRQRPPGAHRRRHRAHRCGARPHGDSTRLRSTPDEVHPAAADRHGGGGSSRGTDARRLGDARRGGRRSDGLRRGARHAGRHR